MLAVLGSILILIFFFLSALHFYWAFGGKWGLSAAIPTKKEGAAAMKPHILGAVVVALGLLAMGVLYAVKSGFISIALPQSLLYYAGWIVPSIFLIRVIGDFNYVGLFKKVKSTEFATKDTKYFVPLCAFLALVGFLIQIYQ